MSDENILPAIEDTKSDNGVEYTLPPDKNMANKMSVRLANKILINNIDSDISKYYENLQDIDKLTDILKKYVLSEDTPILEDDIINIDENELENGCRNRLISIKKCIREILIIKMALNKKKVVLDEDLNNDIMKRLENELYFNRDDEMKKMFKECGYKLDSDTYLQIAKKIKIDDEGCIILIF